MALYRSPEFKGVIVQIVCATEIQLESAKALTKIALGTHALPKGSLYQLSSSTVAGCGRKLLSTFHFHFKVSNQISSI